MNLKFNKKNYKSNLVEFSEFIFQKYFFMPPLKGAGAIKITLPRLKSFFKRRKIFILIKMYHSITQKNINSGVIN